MHCRNCGKELMAEDKFCSKCGTAVGSGNAPKSQSVKERAAQTAPSSPDKTAASSAQDSKWPMCYGERADFLEWLARSRFAIGSNDFIAGKMTQKDAFSNSDRMNVSSAAQEMQYLAALKKMDRGVQQTPDPVTVAERRAYWQEALQLIERRITPEAKAKDKKNYDIDVSKRDYLRRDIKKANSGKMASQVVVCPHCHKWTDTDYTHCVHCYKSINPYAPRMVPQAGQPITSSAAPAAPRAASAATYQAAPRPAAVHQPQAAAQVCYADDSVKDWVKFTGERTVRSRHAIGLLQPAGGKFTYHMEVTDRRILLWKESSGSSTFGYVARMGGGLLGSLIAEGVKAAAGTGPKPWVEIPLGAVSSCGLRNKAEFFITADQTYVLKNMKYDKFLPELVENAKK